MGLDPTRVGLEEIRVNIGSERMYFYRTAYLSLRQLLREHRVSGELPILNLLPKPTGGLHWEDLAGFDCTEELDIGDIT